ncbi:MAG: MFS transporter [Candidatus Bipolaricaulia bacterium]
MTLAQRCTLFATVEPSSQQQPGGRRRAIRLAGSMVFISASIHFLWLVLQLFLKSRGVPTFWIGMVATINAAGMLIGGLVWGPISDHVRRKRLLFFLIIGLSTSIGLLVFLPPTSVILGTSFARALFFTGFGAVTIAIISGSSRAERRGKNLSYVGSARALGFALGAVSSGFLLEWLGFRAALGLATILPLLALAFIARLPAENPVQRAPRSNAWKEALSRGLGDLYLALALRQMAVFGAFALLYIYMDTLGISPSLMGVVASVNTLTQVLALIAFGRLADRIGRRRVFMLGFALSILTPCSFVIVPNIYGMVLGYILLGLSFSSLHVGATAHIGDLVPEERQGQMLGLYESSRGLGGLAGPAVAGVLIPLIDFRGMFLVMAGIASLGFLLMLVGRIIRRRHSQSAQPAREDVG